MFLVKSEIGAARRRVQISEDPSAGHVRIQFAIIRFSPFHLTRASDPKTQRHRATFGKALILDGIIQCTERDEFGYQELIAFIPLCCHRRPRKVLIVGGGDGGVAREVAKHPLVEEVHQVEIDERVVALAREHLPFMASGFESPKMRLTIGDGFAYMQQHAGEFDVIITDSSDPIGPAAALFQESYFARMRAALRPGGIVCSQGGTFWADMRHVRETLDHCRAQFASIGYAVASVPSYPCGQIGFVLGSLDGGVDLAQPQHRFDAKEIDRMQLRYYTSATHSAAFALPRFAEKELFS